MLEPKLDLLQERLLVLETRRDMESAKSVILAAVGLLIPDADSLNFRLFRDGDGKLTANASWFQFDEEISDRRATYTLDVPENSNLDVKVFAVAKANMQTMSWVVGLTPNFEDEPFNTKFNVGIDFIIPESKDRVIIVLSKNYTLRTMELKGHLTATFQEILSSWLGISDTSNKAEFHSLLWNSLDLHPINKKFYEGISQRFIGLRQHLESSGIFDNYHASQFANRLIGRIIFAWFLDKKDLISSVPGYFNSEDFSNDSDFYIERLEPLFFEVLNTPINDRSFSDLITPYLNGGLFEPKEGDFYRLDKVRFPVNFFDDFFKFLRSYNFTTDESSSEFQQVAIDPEMLGRIFENLLAEVNEETGEQARQAKGAFYTPRQVVDFMCRESLKEYLRTKLTQGADIEQRLYQLIDATEREYQDQDHNWRRDLKPYKEEILEALDSLRVLDPACGSGAYPMGMLQLLMKVYNRIEPRFDPYKAKFSILENNIFGVDVEPMAVEISRLRAWLALVVDDDADKARVKPLPNLDFKFVCANSLLHLNNSSQVSLFDDHDLDAKLQEIRIEYFSTQSLAKKSKLKEKYSGIVNQELTLFGESQRTSQLKSFRPFEADSVANFFDQFQMFGVDDFNILIGNPPYVSAVKSVKANLENRDTYRSTYKQLSGAFDLYTVFLLRGLDLLAPEGVYSWIIPNKISVAAYAKGTTAHLKANGLKSLVNVSTAKIFDASVYPVVILGRNHGEPLEYSEYSVEAVSELSKPLQKSDNTLLTPSRFSLLNENGVKMSSGATGFQAQLLKEYVSGTAGQGKIPFTVSGCIDPYVVLNKPVRYMGNKYESAFVEKRDTAIAESKWKLWEQEKIVIAGMTKRIEAVYVDSPLGIGVGTYAIHDFGNFDKFTLLGILNSRFVSYYLTTKFKAKHLAGGYLAINKETLEQLPVPSVGKDDKRMIRIGELAKELNSDTLDKKSRGKAISEIDSLVFELFEITNEEQALINFTIEESSGMAEELDEVEAS